MTNKLVAIINSPKVPKIKKILLYEMKFLVPNYSCLQNPWLGGYRLQIPVLSVLNWICWTPPPNKLPGYATGHTHLILLYLITRTIFGEQYRSLSSSLCSFLHSPVPSSLPKPHLNSALLLTSAQVSEHRQRSLAQQAVWPHPQTTCLFSCGFSVFTAGRWQRSANWCNGQL